MDHGGADALLSPRSSHHIAVMEENARLRRRVDGFDVVVVVRENDATRYEYMSMKLIELPDMLRKLVLFEAARSGGSVTLNLTRDELLLETMLSGRFIPDLEDGKVEDHDVQQAYADMLRVADEIYGGNLEARTRGWELFNVEDDWGGFEGYPSIIFHQFTRSLQPVLRFISRVYAEKGWSDVPDLLTPAATKIFI